ncbi:DUF1284 domain-containing protein [Stappia sp.]|uniref:DUF1284 domain-containing protein n=1 Tax=Stappia sp. TaxID=1870903 RepID=UPI0032D987E3
MIRLRGHHLLCTLTFAGRGYTRAFERNYEAVIRRLKAGTPILIVDGPDDICQPMLAVPDHHCHEARIVDRDRHALAEVGQALGREIAIGCRLDPGELLAPPLAARFADGSVRTGCLECQWKPVCDGIAARGFRGTRLFDDGSP